MAPSPIRYPMDMEESIMRDKIQIATLTLQIINLILLVVLIAV